MAGQGGGSGEGFSPKDQLKRLRQNGMRTTLSREHHYIMKQQSQCYAFLLDENACKNRFSNMLLLDESRVKLRDQFKGDYIHASWVDGYDQAKELILCQAPFSPPTELDVWRLVWQTKPTVIALLTTLAGADNNLLCSNFWPSTGKENTYEEGKLRVRTDSIKTGNEYDTYDLSVRSGQLPALHLRLVHYRQWLNDDDIPSSIVNLHTRVRQVHREVEDRRGGKRREEDLSPPRLVMCCSGVTRSGTFAALDICLRRLQRSQTVAQEDTVRIVRQQRYGALHLLNHYLFLTEAIVNQAIQLRLVEADDVQLDLRTTNKK